MGALSSLCLDAPRASSSPPASWALPLRLREPAPAMLVGTRFEEEEELGSPADEDVVLESEARARSLCMSPLSWDAASYMRPLGARTRTSAMRAGREAAAAAGARSAIHRPLARWSRSSFPFIFFRPWFVFQLVCSSGRERAARRCDTSIRAQGWVVWSCRAHGGGWAEEPRAFVITGWVDAMAAARERGQLTYESGTAG